MRSRLPLFLIDVAVAVRFYSRLPVPVLPGEESPHAMPEFSRVSRAVPFAGAIIGCVGAAVLMVTATVGLPPLVCALAALAALVAATGCFHEDGLADTFDGMGGATRERRLEIMKDSRIGSYGAAALVLALLLRATLIAELLVRAGPIAAALALIAVAAVTRTAALWLGYALEPARSSGAAYAAGRPSDAAFLQAILGAVLLALVLIWPSGGLSGVAAGLAAAAVAAYLMGRLASHLIGGQTGDLAGASQQVAEVLMLTALVLTHKAA